MEVKDGAEQSIYYIDLIGFREMTPDRFEVTAHDEHN